MYGPECSAGSEDPSAYEIIEVATIIKKNFNCTVTTWTNNEDNREFHTWRAWGSGVRKKAARLRHGPIGHTLYDMVPELRLRTWDHFLVISRVQGRELKTKKCVKGWARWILTSEAEKTKFQELVLCPRSDQNAVACDAEEGEGLVLLHDRLVSAAAEVRGTWTNFVYLMKSGR